MIKLCPLENLTTDDYTISGSPEKTVVDIILYIIVISFNLNSSQRNRSFFCNWLRAPPKPLNQSWCQETLHNKQRIEFHSIHLKSIFLSTNSGDIMWDILWILSVVHVPFASSTSRKINPSLLPIF